MRITQCRNCPVGRFPVRPCKPSTAAYTEAVCAETEHGRVPAHGVSPRPGRAEMRGAQRATTVSRLDFDEYFRPPTSTTRPALIDPEPSFAIAGSGRLSGSLRRRGHRTRRTSGLGREEPNARQTPGLTAGRPSFAVDQRTVRPSVRNYGVQPRTVAGVLCERFAAAHPSRIARVGCGPTMVG